MSSLGLYVPGQSTLHRLPAGFKLSVLLLAGIGSIFVGHAWQVVVLLAIVAIGYLWAGFRLSTALRQIRPLIWLLGFLAVFQLVLYGWDRALTVVGVIAFLVLLAALVTLTTRTTAMSDVIVRLCGPLQVFGVNPERVGLLLALGVRAVPVVITFAQEIRDAQRARGLTSSPRAFAAPLIVRCLRHGDALGDALVARGFDD